MQIVGAGRCFVLFGVPKPHFWIVLTDPVGDPPAVIAVMLVSEKAHTEKTLVLDVGDHPWIDHRTAVDFGSAQRWLVDSMIRASAKSHCGMEADASPKLLEQVRQGLLESSHTVDWLRDLCRERFPK